MKKKLLCTVLSATMVAAMLAGCGSSDSGNNTDTQQPAQSQEQQPAQSQEQQPAMIHSSLRQTHRHLRPARERFII